MKINKSFSLVADIGGTNARFALVEGTGMELIESRSLVCADYPTIVDAIKDYLETVSSVAPKQAAISIASPITGDQLTMTNHSWNFKVSEIRGALGWDMLKVLNDYSALALALPFLREDQCLKIGAGEICAGYAKAVIGPGTGLGVSGVIPVNDFWVPLESEGGHVSYGGMTEREVEIIRLIKKKFNHVSAESLVSGPGISSLYETITELELGKAEKLTPAEITTLAIDENSAMAIEALSVFSEILGTVAGNLALTLGARGGVYLGGGILGRLTQFFIESRFRDRFEQHGRFTGYLSQIPTYLINAEYPALIGATVSLNQAYNSIGWLGE